MDHSSKSGTYQKGQKILYAMQESVYQSQPYHGKSSKRPNGHRNYVHPNDRTVPMDVDPPVYTYVRHAYTEEDKRHLQTQGRCFNCEKQGHMARHCPKRKHQQPSSTYRQRPSGYGQKPFQPCPGPPTPFKKKPFNPSKPSQGFRKSNKPKRFPFTPQSRVAHIEEIIEEEEEEDEDNEDNNVSSLAARMAQLSK